MSVTQIDLSLNKLSCHESALIAFNQSKNVMRQFDGDYPIDLVRLMQQQEPLHVVKCDDKSYRFFAGWYWLSYARKNNLNKIWIIKHLVNVDEIQKWAWSYLLSVELKTLHRGDSLAHMAGLMAKMPRGLRAELLGGLNSRSAVKIVEKLSGETRAAIRYQMPTQDKSTDDRTILDQLIGE